MQHRDGMRQRLIDDNKPYQVIRDIESAKKTLPPEDLKELEKIENDLYKAIKHFDNKKKIQIPKSIILEKNKLNNNIEKNNKNEINEKDDKNDKKKQNNNIIQNDIPNYELKEYKRPNHYIIYSSKERDQIKVKDYEGKYPDQVFLNFHGDFMKLDVLENIISTLENNIGKGEKIPDEMAKKIIEENFSKYKSKSDLIIKHFNDRRNELKKSLLRKYWRLQKSTDKYFSSTFRRREREKMKIRKNNQKKEESFEKVKMSGDLCKNHLLKIINDMAQKETLNKKKSLIENLAFLSKINQIKSEKIPQDYINKNKEIISQLKGKGITIDEKSIALNEEMEKTKDTATSQYKELGTSSTRSTRAELSKDDSGKKDDESFLSDIKSNNQEIIYPPISFDSLNSSKDKNKNKVINNNNYRVRIRLNRIKKLTVDRYIQKDDSMDPFDDAFNEKIMKYQKYDPSLAINTINYNCFENLIKEYYEQKYKLLSFFSDSDDEYESILKTKKNNKRIINKKRAYNK